MIILEIILPDSTLAQKIFSLLSHFSFFQILPLNSQLNNQMKSPKPKNNSPSIKRKNVVISGLKSKISQISSISQSCPSSPMLDIKGKHLDISKELPKNKLVHSNSLPILSCKVENLSSPPEMTDLKHLKMELKMKEQNVLFLQKEVLMLDKILQEEHNEHIQTIQQLCSLLSQKEKHVQMLEQRSTLETPKNKHPTLELENNSNDSQINQISWFETKLKRLEYENTLKMKSKENYIQTLESQLNFFQTLFKTSKFLRTSPPSPSSPPRSPPLSPRSPPPSPSSCLPSSFPSFLPSSFIRSHMLENLRNENEELRIKYFFLLAISSKLQTNGKFCNIEISELYEKAKKESIDFQTWPNWINYQFLT